MKYLLITLMFTSSNFLLAKPKFTDQQIAAMTPQYFKRNHSAPKLTGLKNTLKMVKEYTMLK